MISSSGSGNRGVDAFQTYLDGQGSLSPEEKERALVSAVRSLKKQVDAVQNAQVLLLGAVVGVIGDRMLLATASEGTIVVHCPDYLDPKPKEGDVVRATKDGVVLLIEKDPPAYGPIARVKKILRPGALEVGLDGGSGGFLVYDRTRKVVVGSEVVLDSSRTVVVKDLGIPTNELAMSEDTGVSWDDIAGQDAAKAALREAIEGPILHAELYREFGKSPCKGILLYGAPGNGKTLAAKAIATSAATLAGRKRTATGFLYVKGPEVLNSYVGASEGKVRQIFADAREHQKKHGYPAIVCIDEGDAILGKRTDSKISMEKTIVPQFLAEMDGLDPSSAIVVILTNRPDTLDPAVTRDGRVDLKVEIPRPKRDEAKAILAYHLGKKLHAPGQPTSLEMAEAAVEEIWAHRSAVFMLRVHRGMDSRIGLAHFVSGAMCAGIADRATQRAIRRFLSDGGPKGITSEDLVETVKETPESLKRLSLGDDTIRSIVGEYGGADVVKSIEPL